MVDKIPWNIYIKRSHSSKPIQVEIQTRAISEYSEYTPIIAVLQEIR